jgi:hypothetical protein
MEWAHNHMIHSAQKEGISEGLHFKRKEQKKQGQLAIF